MNKNNNIFDRLSRSPLIIVFALLLLSMYLLFMVNINTKNEGIKSKELVSKANAYINSIQKEKDPKKRKELNKKIRKIIFEEADQENALIKTSKAFYYLVANRLDSAYYYSKNAEILNKGYDEYSKHITYFNRLINEKLAIALINDGQFDRGYQLALEGLNEGINPELLNVIGVYYYSKGRNDSASIYFQTALQYNPKLNSARENLMNLLIKEGEIKLKNGQVDLALQIHRQALQLDPNNVSLLLLISEEALELNKRNKFDKFIKKVLELDPDNKKAKKLLKRAQ